MIPKLTVDKIIETARIEEVVGDFVSLKKRGASLLGLCPFHNEKSPSFNVSVAKGIYKCFGCGKAGNAVSFIMEHEQMTFPESLRYLAKKYNIEIEEQEQTPEQINANNDRESLHIVTAFAQKYYTENLFSSDEGKAIGLSYFKERGFRDDIIEKFQLGYSLEDRKAFSKKALESGYKLEYLVKAGLTISKELEENQVPDNINQVNYFDRFSGRVIFPIHSAAGRPIAFGGRILKSDKKMAKYINSPETDIYHKSNVLYGLYFAKRAITADDVCFLVEGYTDVISLHQAGIENVVSSSGTSLTVEQIRLIKRYTPNITILYDGDAAGIKASFRGIDMILEEGMNVRVLLFPDGDDPDSYSKRVSQQELKEFIQLNTKNFIAFKTNLLFKDTDNDPIKKAGLIKDIVESIAVIPEAINRSVYIKECSRIMQIDEQTLINEMNKLRSKKSNDKHKHSESQLAATESQLTELPPDITEETKVSILEYQERDIIRLLLNYTDKSIMVESEDEEGKPTEVSVLVPELIVHELSNDNTSFDNPTYQTIYQNFVEGIANDTIPDMNFFITQHNTEIAKVVIDLISSPYTLAKWEQHNILVQTEDQILKRSIYNAIYALKARQVEKMLWEVSIELKANLAEDDLMILLTKQAQLLEAKKQFNKLLGRIIIK